MAFCSQCGVAGGENARFCASCGTSLSTVATTIPAAPILDRVVTNMASRGFRQTTRTPTSVQLIHPKVFSGGWAFFWLLMFGVGILVYLVYYAAKRDDHAFVELRPDGMLVVDITIGGWARRFVYGAGTWTCLCPYAKRGGPCTHVQDMPSVWGWIVEGL